MSRTYRNRKTVPKGLRVNDGCLHAIDSEGVKYRGSDDWVSNMSVEIDPEYRKKHNETFKIADHKFWGPFHYHTFRWNHTCWYIGYHGVDLDKYFEWDPGADAIDHEALQ